MSLYVFLKKCYRFFYSRPKKSILDFLNKSGHKKKCYICKKEFNHFGRYRNGRINLSAYKKEMNITGSDPDNYSCPFCGANDRERHLFMYFDKLNFWDKISSAKVLHFAPESSLSKKLEQMLPAEYIKGDLFPKNDWRKIDITKIDFEDNYFDIVICNHVIEHVQDYLKALKEISRVVKKNGIAILQTPYSELLYNNFEDRNINTNELRLLYYGQEDHVRIVSKRQFFDELSQYFTVNIVKNQSLFSDDECYKFGVNSKEDLIMVINNKGK